MFRVSRITYAVFTSLALATVFSCAAWSQTPDRKASSLANESDAMRRLLIEHYSESQLFGELLSKNAKIRGTAGRLKKRMESDADWSREAASLDQLLLDLETKIEQANFQDSRTASGEVSRQLGIMVSRINSLKRGSDTEAVPPQAADSGILTSVVETDFAPPETGNRPQDLNAPLIMGSQDDLKNPPPIEFPGPRTIPDNTIEIPAPAPDLDANGVVQLPDLTVPSPEIVEQNLTQTLLKPLSLPAEPHVFDRNRLPHLQAPVPLNYGNNVLPSRPRFTIPIQFEFHTFNPGGFFGYQPYGGYWGNRGYGGYGTGGRYCPNRW